MKENENEKDSIKSDLKHLDAMTDDDIDYPGIPELDDEFWAKAEWYIGGKKAISIRVDEEVLAFFKSKGKGYQAALNNVLRQYMTAHTKKRQASQHHLGKEITE
jgi:uncharacterized protein (DUF4415 family)